MDQLPALAAMLMSPQGRAILAAGNPGKIVKLFSALSQVLDIPPAALGLATKSDPSRTLDDMDRRHVLGGTIALAVTALLPHGVATAGRISAADVTQCWTALRRMHELDGYQGGAAVFERAAGLARRLQNALHNGSYSASVGRNCSR